jgi:hypothetical protein
MNRFVGAETTKFRWFYQVAYRTGQENFGIPGREVNLGNNGLQSQYKVIVFRCLSN